MQASLLYRHYCYLLQHPDDNNRLAKSILRVPGAADASGARSTSLEHALVIIYYVKQMRPHLSTLVLLALPQRCVDPHKDPDIQG
jgi:hypothetical protein